MSIPPYVSCRSRAKGGEFPFSRGECGARMPDARREAAARRRLRRTGDAAEESTRESLVARGGDEARG